MQANNTHLACGVEYQSVTMTVVSHVFPGRGLLLFLRQWFSSGVWSSRHELVRLPPCHNGWKWVWNVQCHRWFVEIEIWTIYHCTTCARKIRCVKKADTWQSAPPQSAIFHYLPFESSMKFSDPNMGMERIGTAKALIRSSFFCCSGVSWSKVNTSPTSYIWFLFLQHLSHQNEDLSRWQKILKVTSFDVILLGQPWGEGHFESLTWSSTPFNFSTKPVRSKSSLQSSGVLADGQS